MNPPVCEADYLDGMRPHGLRADDHVVEDVQSVLSRNKN